MSRDEDSLLSKSRCDECELEDVKISRKYRGHRYCQTCYGRVFKRRPCPKCKNFARLPIHIANAVCRTCERTQPCVRCGRFMTRVGRMTAYGPACGACAHYFKEPMPCEACETPSTRLARSRRLGHDLRLCPRCVRADHGTCEACRRHRPLQDCPDGRKLCTPCREQGDIPCPQCGEPMPSGCGKRCWECYWDAVADKRIRINCAAFFSEVMAQRFEAFGTWLVRTTGNRKAARTIHRYLPFFVQIERGWRDIPDYPALLTHFGARELRRQLLPMRWMEQTSLVTVDAAARETDSDRRRIAQVLDRFPHGAPARTILVGYHDAMIRRYQRGETMLRSIRLALSPAGTLLQAASEMARMPPDQKVLDALLRKSPGQRAALSGFVNYLHNTLGIEIQLPKDNAFAARRKRRRKLEREVLALMREGGFGEDFERRWICTALAYFHDLPRRAVRYVAMEDIRHDENGVHIRIKGSSYWIPRPEAGGQGVVTQ